MRTSILLLLVNLALCAVTALGCEEATLDESLTNLNIGECVRDTPAAEVEELERVDCEDPEAVRVNEKFDLEGYGEFPGNETLDDIVIEQCPPETLVWLVPTKETWEQLDDRLVICFE
jgi:hypothetical protein